MDLSIIQVNYKSAKLVMECIESIYRHTSKYTFEIILVDNNSEDDCEKLLLEKYPEVRFLPLDYNAGFARANNAGTGSLRVDTIVSVRRNACARADLHIALSDDHE